MPPLTAFDPSRAAFSLRNSCSAPSLRFHDVTVAPNRFTATESPEGRDAVTVPCSTLTRGCDSGVADDEVMGIEEGFLGRSIVCVCGRVLLESFERRERRGIGRVRRYRSCCAWLC